MRFKLSGRLSLRVEVERTKEFILCDVIVTNKQVLVPDEGQPTKTGINSIIISTKAILILIFPEYKYKLYFVNGKWATTIKGLRTTDLY